MAAKVFGIGLPRTAGQSLQQALAIILKREVWHSVDSLDVIKPEHGGAVECWFPISEIEKAFPGSLYILNVRDRAEWLESCRSVYGRSQSESWNNPLWREPLEEFPAYADKYLVDRLGTKLADRMLIWDITQDPCWGPLCAFLHVNPPTASFPRLDRVKCPQFGGPVVSNPFLEWDGGIGRMK